MVQDINQVDLMVSWVMRKYVKFLVLGALSSCALLNLALRAGTGLHYYCQDECLTGMLKSPLKSFDKDVIQHIRDYWLDPPAPRGSYKPDFPLENPPWSTVGNWAEAYKFINDYFKNYKNPGTYMEIGAQDGEFASLSLFVGERLGFRGVLVEPNPYHYQKIRAGGRSAYSINACATPDGGHRKNTLWLRHTPGNLPPLLHRIQEGSNRLLQYVSKEVRRGHGCRGGDEGGASGEESEWRRLRRKGDEDRELGDLVEVQCFSAGAIARAALNTSKVDFLVISTHGGEMDILSALGPTIMFRMIVVVVPLATKQEYDELDAAAKSRGLITAFNKNNIHILIPENEVKIV
ncbi:hypothetical protein Hamer_G005837 [Homarus americanus]|uniref:Methyltransferase FkbM domain-containing protein n=1 Tax=Homarus americanus TaxID=6706 RepID=A0A8J5JJW3_HOMAM|nr:hypothetical protein Hamer_G005837 [Homarus americanus]